MELHAGMQAAVVDYWPSGALGFSTCKEMKMMMKKKDEEYDDDDDDETATSCTGSLGDGQRRGPRWFTDFLECKIRKLGYTAF